MPIDRDPDEPGRPREAPGARADLNARDGSVAPGAHGPRDGNRDPAFRERQLAAHARYRADVEAAEQAFEARRSWAEAVPGLRAAWAAHEAKHPQRLGAEPHAQADDASPSESRRDGNRPDGSWAGDAGRRLTPEQNAEATKACADLKDEADQVVLPAMRRVEAASPDGRLAGLEHMLKGEDRLKEKIAVALEAPGVTAREAIDLVPDAVRFTLTYDAERYADGVLANVDQLKAEGFELIKLKNLWHGDQYKGVNSQWRRPDTGLRFEMQFHTPESREAKELTHKAYERIRSQTVPASEKLELEGFQRHVNGLVFIPPRIDAIKDFPE